ncbi:MAG: extracellular solute-binding protein [Lachnospiraceae bacterium]|nr:extracellular solute-binding protein [Lachnospiraceae bacterium]
MHIKGRLFAILLTVVMASGAILGGKQEIRFREKESQAEETVWTSKKETIYVWYADADLESYLSSAAVSFGEQEGVRVIPVHKTTTELLQEAYEATMDPEKQKPDALVINNDELAKAYLSGMADEAVSPSGLFAEAWFPKSALSAVTYHGKKVAYPFYYETTLLVYNKDYLDMWVRQQADRQAIAALGLTEEDEEAVTDTTFVGEDGVPMTVEGLLQFADTFDAPEGVEGVMKWDVEDIFYNYWIVGEYLIVGGESGDDSDDVNIYNEETMACLQTYQALNQFFFIEAGSVTSESALQDFIEGKLVFTIGTTDVLKKLEKATEDGEFDYEYGVAVLPDVSDTLKSRTLSVTKALAINGFSEHKELANRFAEYVTCKHAADLYPKTGKMAASLTASRGDALLSICEQQYAKSVSLPKMMEIGNLWLQLEAVFSKAWNGEEILPLLQDLEKQISTQITEE